MADWRKLLEEEQYGRVEHNLKFQKLRKEKRSVRGRTTDDWFVPVDTDEFVARCMTQGYRNGRVVEVHKRNVFVAEESPEGIPDTGLLWLCSIAKRHFQRAHKERNFVVVGDRILFIPDKEVEFSNTGDVVGTDLPRGIVQHSFVRKSRISRRDPLNPDWEHVMLANVDRVIIVASVLNPEVRWGLIDRLLVQAEIEDLPAVIVLNKVDLLEKSNLANQDFLLKYQSRVATYRKIGYEVVEICALKPARTPEGIARLKELFVGKLVGLAGHSGVGKSSVLNLMQPEFEQIVDADPDIFYKGRHTTSFNSLLQLGIGGYAIDTPGVRSFAIHANEASRLSACFPEFRNIKCRYRECAHGDERECNIKAAVVSGEIHKDRYRSYIGMLRGESLREGEGDSTDATMIADLKARSQHRDDLLANNTDESFLEFESARTDRELDVVEVLQGKLKPEAAAPVRRRSLRALLSKVTPTND